LRKSDGKKPILVANFYRLNLLMIEEPTPKQLQNIEDLQKELRSLMRTRIEDITEERIGLFAKKIFTVKEAIS
jgi:hypothetical protein